MAWAKGLFCIICAKARAFALAWLGLRDCFASSVRKLASVQARWVGHIPGKLASVRIRWVGHILFEDDNHGRGLFPLGEESIGVHGHHQSNDGTQIILEARLVLESGS